MSVDAQSVDAWRGYLTALHNLGNDRTVIAEAQRIPAATRALLGAEAGFLTLLASANATEGGTIRPWRSRGGAGALPRPGPPVPADLDLQVGWAMLSSSRSAGVGDLVAAVRGPHGPDARTA